VSDGSNLDWLSAIAREAGEHSEWREFSAFADSRSRGLRTEALRHLSHFIRTANDWEFEERLGFCRWLLGKGGVFGDLGIAAPQPLHANLLVPTIRQWLEREPKIAEAHLWLGLLRCDDPSDHLAHALVLDPNCEQARRVLVEWIIGDIEYNQHELPSVYIHDPRVDLVELDRAADLLTGASTSDETDRQAFEIAELRRLAEAWLAAHPLSGDFAKH
jgi:hypothetical protein